MTKVIHAGKNATSNQAWEDIMSDFSEIADNSTIEVDAPAKEEYVRVAVRGRGKVHPATMHSRYGLMISCSCPGSQNGTLENMVIKVADGWDVVNCGH